MKICTCIIVFLYNNFCVIFYPPPLGARGEAFLQGGLINLLFLFFTVNFTILDVIFK